MNPRQRLLRVPLAELKSRLSEDEQRAAMRAVIRPMLDALEKIDPETDQGEYARRIVGGALVGAGEVDLVWRSRSLT